MRTGSKSTGAGRAHSSRVEKPRSRTYAIGRVGVRCLYRVVGRASLVGGEHTFPDLADIGLVRGTD
jgi:hypothetical protein